MGGQKTLGDIRLVRGYCQVDVHTDGYLEMSSYNDLNTARHIHVSGIPQRSYRNKLVMKIIFPGASDRIRYTICLLMNEIFRTTYPDAYPYICAVTQFHSGEQVPEHLKYAMYTLESDEDDAGIYIVEDSEIDLGLTASVERNLERYLEIITEVLAWHDIKMKESRKRKNQRRNLSRNSARAGRTGEQKEERVLRKIMGEDKVCFCEEAEAGGRSAGRRTEAGGRSAAEGPKPEEEVPSEEPKPEEEAAGRRVEAGGRSAGR